MGHICVRAYLSRSDMTDCIKFCQQAMCEANEIVEDIEPFILYCPAYSSTRDIFELRLRNINMKNLSLKTCLLGEKRHVGKQIEILNHLIE